MNARYFPFNFIFQSGPCLSATSVSWPRSGWVTPVLCGGGGHHTCHPWVCHHRRISANTGYEWGMSLLTVSAFKWWDLRDVGVRSHGPSVHRRYWFLCFVTGPRPGQLIADSPTHSMRYCIQANQNCLGWKMLPIAGILCNLHICCSTYCRWPQDFCSHIFHSMTHSPGSG